MAVKHVYVYVLCEIKKNIKSKKKNNFGPIFPLICYGQKKKVCTARVKKYFECIFGHNFFVL